jgi:glycosyltransferase involved in cell wall biosynthesis
VVKNYKNGLSLVLIASNEELNIGRCLKSVHSIADEIVVVYNDCTDRTVEIAKSFDANCYERSWLGYMDQKNFAMSKANYAWILFLDADEALSIDLKSSISSFLRNSNELKILGCQFNRKSFFLGRWINHGDWYPDTKLRLIKNGYARWVGGDLHEKLEFTEKDQRMFLDGDLLHYSYHSMESVINQMINFSNIYLNLQIEAKDNWKLNRVLFRPPWRFFRAYFIKLGFLDGFPGFFIAVSSAFSCFFKYSRIYERLKAPSVFDDN